MSSSGVPLLATIMVLLFLQQRFVLSTWWPELDESSDEEYPERDDSDLKRIDELLLLMSHVASPPHRLQHMSYFQICAQILCSRRGRDRPQLQACIRRNCRPFSAAAAEADLPLDGRPGMMMASLHRPCSGPFCIGENEDPEEQEKEEKEQEYHDEDETSPAAAVSSLSFDDQQSKESSSLDDEATWRAAGERHKTTTTTTHTCESICRHLANEVFYGSCIRHLCRSTISSSSAPADDGIMASTYGTVAKRPQQQQTMKMQAMEHPSIWKRYGMRICAEAFCKSHYGYELVACGLSHCHGK